MAVPVTQAALANGLKVLVQEEHTAPLASVWCWYKVGSKLERPGLTGVSHWVEHMNFKGTTNIPRDQVKGIIEQVGGSWNGYTWIDQTTYFETATRDALDRMLFIEAERMANCLYHPDDCESERTVIISELQGGENDPDQFLDQELTATAFKAHPYRHPTIGWLSDLQTMTRDDLYGYYRRHYVPNNATLVIVGDVDTAEALRRVRASFRRHSGRRAAVARTRTIEPEQTGERRVTVRREGTTAYLKVGYHAPAIGDPAFFPLLVLDAVLTGAKGLNLWSSFRAAAGAAPRAPLSRARRARARVGGRRRAAPDPGAVSLHDLGDGDRGDAARRGRGGAARSARRGPARRHHRGGAREGQAAVEGAARVRQRQRHQHRAPAGLLRDDRRRRHVPHARAIDRGGDARRGRGRRVRRSRRRTGRSAGSIRSAA